jgi:hypothetical protein
MCKIAAPQPSYCRVPRRSIFSLALRSNASDDEPLLYVSMPTNSYPLIRASKRAVGFFRRTASRIETDAVASRHTL